MKLFSAQGDTVSITEGGNTATVLAALADNLDNANNPLVVASHLLGFASPTWDRLVSGGDDVNNVATGTEGRLFVAARLFGFQGSTWDIIRAEGTDRDGIAVVTQGELEAIIFGHVFNGTSWDRQRGLGSVSLDGLGQASVSSAVPGAGVVISFRHPSLTNSTTRVTIITPASGKRIRITSVETVNDGAGPGRVELYFGTGANIGTTPANAICDPFLDGDFAPNFQKAWTDGSGPVGAVDAVVSFRTSADLSSAGSAILQFREE